MRNVLFSLLILLSWFNTNLNAFWSSPEEKNKLKSIVESPSRIAAKDERMQWWRDARFGMFIHWGVYSVYGNNYEGLDVNGEMTHYHRASSGYPSEWIMNLAKIPRAEYRKAAQEFDASQYDPKEWVRIAKEAGMKYIVITAKHHDGFCLFDTQYTEWDAIDGSAAKKDLLKELVQEAKNAGLKIGFYYSQNLDWMHEGGMGGIPELHGALYPEEKVESYVDNVVIPHIQELTSNYDIDLFWFDIPGAPNTTEPLAQKILNALQNSKVGNKVIINDRLGKGFMGDFETRETDTPAIPYNGYSENLDWEACASLNNSWGYEENPDWVWKTPVYSISRLLELTSKGGNFLLNVGPDKHGNFPQPAKNTLKGVGEWMSKNSSSIYGTVKNELLNPFEYGYVTQKNNIDGSVHLYLHVSSGYWKDSVIYLDGITELPQSASLLVSGKTIEIKQKENRLAIQLPKEPLDSTYTVIDLNFSQMPKQSRVSPLRGNEIHLTPFIGIVNEPLKKDYIPYAFKDWYHSSCVIEFKVFLEPGVYSLQAEYAALDPGEMYLDIRSSKYTLLYKKTNNTSYYYLDDYVTEQYPECQINVAVPAVYDLKITRKEAPGYFNIINLRKIVLKLDTTASITPLSKDQSFLVYPNPTDDILFIYVSYPQLIQVFDLNGHQIKSQFVNLTGEVDVSSEPPGVYIVKGEKQSQRIIVK